MREQKPTKYCLFNKYFINLFVFAKLLTCNFNIALLSNSETYTVISYVIS
jgi:hypothetical protein